MTFCLDRLCLGRDQLKDQLKFSQGVFLKGWLWTMPDGPGAAGHGGEGRPSPEEADHSARGERNMNTALRRPPRKCAARRRAGRAWASVGRRGSLPWRRSQRRRGGKVTVELAQGLPRV